MNKTCALLLVAATLLATLGPVAGCSTPSLSPLADDATSVRDDALVGEWKNDDYRATVVASPGSSIYKVAISSVEDDEIKASTNLEMRTTRIGEHAYLDLFLAKSERRKLAEQYGGLVIPTHQIMRYTIADDVLNVWFIAEGELPGSDGRTKITYGDGVSEALTADTAALRALIQSAPAGAFEHATELHRVR